MLGLFTLLGGAIGGLVLAVAFAVLEPSQIDGAWLVYVWAFPLYGAAFGLPSAFVGGGIYVSLPAGWQRISFAPVVGFAVSFAIAALIWVVALAGANGAGLPPFEVCLFYAGRGAASAVCCASLARVFKIDRIGSGDNRPRPI